MPFLARLVSLLLFGAAIAFSPKAVAALSVHAPFSDGAVLQRDRAVVIRGDADPGAQIHVRLGDETISTHADTEGRWQIIAGAHPAWTRLDADIRSASEHIEVRDLLFGDVWLASGQSNIAWTINKSADAELHKADADQPALRFVAIPTTIADTPRRSLTANWFASSPETIGDISAISYHFGRRIQSETGVPVGIILGIWGGTWIESWIPHEVLAADPDFSPAFERWQGVLDAHPAARARYEVALRDWLEAYRANGNQPPPGHPRPEAPRGPGHPHQPASVFNGLVHPLAGTPLRGVIWYQGESNTRRAWIYRRLLPAMINSWRELWDDPVLPFVVAQLPRYGRPAAFDADSEWAALRESQRIAVDQTPHTALAVLIDTGEPDQIHPSDKLTPGIRIADTALASVYGRADIPLSGPRLRCARAEDAEFVLEFSAARNALRTSDSAAPRGFVIAGEDRVWRPDSARLAGASLRLSHPEVPRPVAARYAWAGFPDGNLTDATGLPAEPFRTDVWPGPTDDRR